MRVLGPAATAAAAAAAASAAAAAAAAGAAAAAASATAATVATAAAAMLLVAASLDFPGLPRTLPPPSKTPPAAQPCNLASCSTVGNKLPRVTSTPAAGPSVESGLAPEDKKAFEHLLGHALRDTAPVCAITRETGLRVASFLRAAGSLRGLSFDDVLRQAFVTPQCDAHNTGYVGPDVRAIRAALEGGNIREVWGLLYVLTKSGYLSRLLLELLEGASPLATPASLQAALGMNASALARRWAEVRVTATLNSTELRYCQGVKDFLFEPYESWVRCAGAHTTRDALATPPWSVAARDLSPRPCKPPSIVGTRRHLLSRPWPQLRLRRGHLGRRAAVARGAAAPRRRLLRRGPPIRRPADLATALRRGAKIPVRRRRRVCAAGAPSAPYARSHRPLLATPPSRPPSTSLPRPARAAVVAGRAVLRCGG